jgi:hypothetical protein
MEMDKEGYDIYQEIKKLKSVSKDEVLMMQQFTKKYIDPKCTICSTCPAQIRFAFNRIINWGDKMKVDELVLDKRCYCGNELKDKRHKKCNNCKK